MGRTDTTGIRRIERSAATNAHAGDDPSADLGGDGQGSIGDTQADTEGTGEGVARLENWALSEEYPTHTPEAKHDLSEGLKRHFPIAYQLQGAKRDLHRQVAIVDAMAWVFIGAVVIAALVLK